MGFQTIGNLSIHRKPAGQIISNITWIVDGLSFFQMYRFSCSKGIFCTGKHHHFPILNLFFQFPCCLCICIFPGYRYFHIQDLLHRRLRIFFRIRILLLFLTAIFFCMSLPFRIRQDDLSAHKIAVTRILWHNPVGCNIGSCLVRVVAPSIFRFDTFQGNILLF